MATEIKVPTLGESISSGIIAAWHVKEGDYVEKDQVIYELETDKITSEGLAEVAGVIALKAEEGDEVEIGQVVAEIDESADAPEQSKSATDDESSEGEEATEPEDRDEREESESEDEKDEGSERETKTDKDDSPKKKEESKKESDAPPAKKSAKAAPSKPAEDKSGRTTRKRLSPLRKKIAQRLVNAQQEAAMLTTFNEVDLSTIKSLRSAHQDAFTEKHGVKLGFMSFFVKAAVRALQAVPAINAMIDGEEIVENHYYDIGIAVSTEKGLIVPVVRDCETLSLASIESEIRNYAEKARSGKIAFEDLQGGVFTITNGGVFGSLLSTPILNAPQSAILGMHTIQDRPVAVDGEVVIRPMMYLALSYDHRIIDGKEAVTFLIKMKQTLENPLNLLLDI